MAVNPSAASTGLMRPILYGPTHLRRWRAAAASSQSVVVPVVCTGDSITFGIGSDGTTTTSNAFGLVHGWCGQLQSLFANSPRTLLQNPGEGFVFPTDSRVTLLGTPIANSWACTAFGQGYRLIGVGQGLNITIPTGVTSVGIIQANQTQAFNSAGSNLADVAGAFNINAGGNTNLTALTNTGVPIVTNVAVTAGQVLQLIGPATAQTYIGGFLLNTAAGNGIQIHRMGLSGFVSGYLLGGQSNGVLLQNANAQNQIYAARACYQFAATPGLIICSFTVNDQQFSLGGGAASQNGVSLALFTTWMAQFAAQAVADGWCVLMLGEPRDIGFAGNATLDQYIGAMKGIALGTDHVAFMDVGEVWGPFASSQADAMQVSNSVHPSLAGHGDMAQMVWDALAGYAKSGITETAVG